VALASAGLHEMVGKGIRLGRLWVSADAAKEKRKSFPFTNLFIKSNPISIQMNFKLWRVPIRKIKYKITHQHKIKYKITHQHKIKYKITHQHKIKYAAV
jgi:hypothetical protein